MFLHAFTSRFMLDSNLRFVNEIYMCYHSNKATKQLFHGVLFVFQKVSDCKLDLFFFPFQLETSRASKALTLVGR